MVGKLRSQPAGAAVAVSAVALTTALIYAVREVAPVSSTGVLYLAAVLLVSARWGLRLGVPTALLSAGAWNYFHIPPVHEFTIADGENWVALGVFLAAAVFAGTLASAARARAVEAERRRAEADLVSELAQVLLAGSGVDQARAEMANHLSRDLGLASAQVELRTVGGDERRLDLPLSAGAERVGTLLVPRDAPAETVETLTRVAPSLAALLVTARRREQLEAELVEAEALRKGDAVKTALLRAISHDLRSPLTAIVTAAEGLGGPGSDELAAVIRSESARLSRLVDDLLDLSRLETGAAPRVDWCSIEEVIESALRSLPEGEPEIRVQVDRDLPLVEADAGQLERALANLLDNARRHGASGTVTVQAKRLRHHLRVRVTDQGPGIPADQLERVFEPFYRAKGARQGGSGLGLAIARGFVEVNGGRLWAESLPGQGTTFVVELPLRVKPRETAPA